MRVNSKGILDIITVNGEIIKTRFGFPCPDTDLPGFVGSVFMFTLKFIVEIDLKFTR